MIDLIAKTVMGTARPKVVEKIAAEPGVGEAIFVVDGVRYELVMRRLDEPPPAKEPAPQPERTQAPQPAPREPVEDPVLVPKDSTKPKPAPMSGDAHARRHLRSLAKLKHQLDAATCWYLEDLAERHPPFEYAEGRAILAAITALCERLDKRPILDLIVELRKKVPRSLRAVR